MALTDRPTAFLARQLGKPSGAVGRIVGRILNRRNEDVVLAAVDAAGAGADSTVVDIGFGGGVGLRALLAVSDHVHGVEVSTTMIDAARTAFADSIEYGRLTLHEAPMDALPFDDAAVDAIVSTNTIYFIDDLDAAFRETARVLRPGGRFAVGIGDPERMAAMAVTSHGFRLRQPDGVADSLRDAGFTSVDHRTLGTGQHGWHLVVGIR